MALKWPFASGPGWRQTFRVTLIVFASFFTCNSFGTTPHFQNPMVLYEISAACRSPHIPRSIHAKNFHHRAGLRPLQFEIPPENGRRTTRCDPAHPES